MAGPTQSKVPNRLLSPNRSGQLSCIFCIQPTMFISRSFLTSFILTIALVFFIVDVAHVNASEHAIDKVRAFDHLPARLLKKRIAATSISSSSASTSSFSDSTSFSSQSKSSDSSASSTVSTADVTSPSSQASSFVLTSSTVKILIASEVFRILI